MAHKTIEEALLTAQKEMPNLIKDSTNPHFKSGYISLHGLLDQVLPVFQKHGILVSQFPDTVGPGIPALTTRFSLPAVAGESTEYTTPLWSAKEDAQGQGGAITYMRRYALMAALGLVAENEDDDGNGSSGSSQKTRSPAQTGRATSNEVAGGVI